VCSSDLQDQLSSHLDGFHADIGEFKKELQAWLVFLDERYSRLTTRIGGIEIPLSPWLVVGIGVVLLVILFFLLNFVGVRVWERWLGKETQPGRLSARKAVKRMSLFFVLVAIPVLAVNLLSVTETVSLVVNKTAFVLVIAVCLYLLGKLVLHFLYRFTSRHGQAVGLAGPLVALVRIALVVTGGLIVLDTMGISITPLLTTLGIGSVAVALALQDTLSNFFAGLYITADKPVRVGDYVKLEDLAEGYVMSISWRSTRILTLKNNVIVVPNQKLAQSVIQNYSLPEKRMALLVPVSVSYESDPQHVERVLREEAVEAAKTVPGLLAEPAPFVRFIPGFGESSLDFTVICQVREFSDQYVVQHELRKRIFTRFKKEGIQIPFPHRTIYVKSEKKGEARAAGDDAIPRAAEESGGKEK
jgi:small-conductance mechanosensitive channel